MHLPRPKTEYFRSTFRFQRALIYNQLATRNQTNAETNQMFQHSPTWSSTEPTLSHSLLRSFYHTKSVLHFIPLHFSIFIYHSLLCLFLCIYQNLYENLLTTFPLKIKIYILTYSYIESEGKEQTNQPRALQLLPQNLIAIVFQTYPFFGHIFSLVT